MIPEFQGGSFDPWGGAGFDNCAILTNEDFEKVFYKNNFASALKIVSYYMTYGGTNWGNLGYPVGYTSYDYGAAIMENREITRAKYSEAKLIANFWQASPAYLTASPQTARWDYTTQTNLSVTPVLDSGSRTGFYVIRHGGPEGTTNYKLNLPTSNGTITVPQIQGYLTLVAKDSKIHLADYPIASYNVLYSSAEIFTQQNYSTYSVAVLYGGEGEVHEMAISGAPNVTMVSGSGVTIKEINGATVLNWQVSSSRKILKVGSDLFVYLIGKFIISNTLSWQLIFQDRNSAYNYWVTYLPGTGSDPFGPFSTSQPVVLNAGYLIRNATVTNSSLYVTGDLNSTTTVEVIGVPSSVSSLYFNGQLINTSASTAPLLSGQVTYNAPPIDLPNLKNLNWKSIDSLPELSSTYDDSLWTAGDLTYTNNTYAPKLRTPSSLYAADYGYNTGSLVYRGHFLVAGLNSTLSMELAGGEGFSASIWLNSTFVGSYVGNASASTANVSYSLPAVSSGSPCVLNVLIDQTGFEESQEQGADNMKAPRGILSYNITGLDQSAVSWKLTGNLHGEAYEDKTRGPLNEGGMYAERQGYHLPSPPSSNWTSSSPMDGTSAPGISFYM
jgi:beta-galactosidase